MARLPSLLLPALACAALLLAACRKEAPAPPAAPAPVPAAWLEVAHHVDGQLLTLDSMCCTNPADVAYSVTRLHYYLSELVLIGAAGTANDTLHGPWYVDAAANTSFPLDGLVAGHYSGARLLLGLPPALNTTGALPNTLANINMAWPGPMGGGYHFMKLEGHFLGTGGLVGFAMHLGTDAFLPACSMPSGFSTTDQGGTIRLSFNINEVFRTPHLYDLDAGNYSMGSPVLMGQLRDNCADAFSLEYLP